jgi:hypothetical protein
MIPPSKQRYEPRPTISRFYARCRNGHEYAGSDEAPWCSECGVEAAVKVVCTHDDHWTPDKCPKCEELPPAKPSAPADCEELSPARPTLSPKSRAPVLRVSVRVVEEDDAS